MHSKPLITVDPCECIKTITESLPPLCRSVMNSVVLKCLRPDDNIKNNSVDFSKLVFNDFVFANGMKATQKCPISTGKLASLIA